MSDDDIWAGVAQGSEHVRKHVWGRVCKVWARMLDGKRGRLLLRCGVPEGQPEFGDCDLGLFEFVGDQEADVLALAIQACSREQWGGNVFVKDFERDEWFMVEFPPQSWNGKVTRVTQPKVHT